jgi:hypothetical protein
MNIEAVTDSLEFSQITQMLEEFFDEESLQRIAYESNFIIRKSSQLSGRMFLLLNTMELTLFPNNSLQDQCIWLEEHFGVSFKKQSLDERYNANSVAFLKSCFEHLLGQWFIKSVPQGLTTCFNRVLLRDSSTWQLPASLASFYQAKGLSKTKSSIKLDYCVDYLTGKVEQIVLASGFVTDATLNMQHKPDYQKNDLIINDLAYWNYKAFKSYHDQEAYFVSRLKSDASLFDSQTGDSIKLEDILPPQDTTVCLECYLAHPKTHKNSIPVRVFIEKVPQTVQQQRLKKLQEQAKKQQWNLSDLRIKLCAYNLYVTNASEQQLPKALIRLIYGIRWQIEIIFKIWKSILEIDQVKPMNIFRFESMLYGRLIVILISNQLQALFKNQIAETDDFELSEIKAVSNLKKN